MKIFVTTRALTEGILEVEAEQSIESPSMVSWVNPGCSNAAWNNYAHGEGRQWHRTREAAIEKAEKMRLDKIYSHAKAIKKLNALKFT